MHKLYVHVNFNAILTCCKASSGRNEHLIVKYPERASMGEHLTCFSACNHERAPMLCLWQLDALEANNWTNNKVKQKHYQLLSWVLMAHNTVNSTMSPWARCIARSKLLLLCLSTKRCIVVNVVEVLHSFLPKICIVLENVLFKLHSWEDSHSIKLDPI